MSTDLWSAERLRIYRTCKPLLTCVTSTKNLQLGRKGESMLKNNGITKKKPMGYKLRKGPCKNLAKEAAIHLLQSTVNAIDSSTKEALKDKLIYWEEVFCKLQLLSAEMKDGNSLAAKELRADTESAKCRILRYRKLLS